MDRTLIVKWFDDFQKIIGEEAKEQFTAVEGKLPNAVVACVGGGSNAIGMFYDFIKEENVRLWRRSRRERTKYSPPCC